MWVLRYLFVGCLAALVLAAMQIWAMGETIDKTNELRLLPASVLPVATAGQWTPPCERLAAIVDEIHEAYGREYTWALLMREAARVRHEG